MKNYFWQFCLPCRLVYVRQVKQGHFRYWMWLLSPLRSDGFAVPYYCFLKKVIEESAGYFFWPSRSWYRYLGIYCHGVELTLYPVALSFMQTTTMVVNCRQLDGHLWGTSYMTAKDNLVIIWNHLCKNIYQVNSHFDTIIVWNWQANAMKNVPTIVTSWQLDGAFSRASYMTTVYNCIYLYSIARGQLDLSIFFW